MSLTRLSFFCFEFGYLGISRFIIQSTSCVINKSAFPPHTTGKKVRTWLAESADDEKTNKFQKRNGERSAKTWNEPRGRWIRSSRRLLSKCVILNFSFIVAESLKSTQKQTTQPDWKNCSFKVWVVVSRTNTSRSLVRLRYRRVPEKNQKNFLCSAIVQVHEH